MKLKIWPSSRAISSLENRVSENVIDVLYDRKRGLVVPLWKGKGDRQDSNNYRGVTLLSMTGKVFARIILDRVRHHLLEHQHPE